MFDTYINKAIKKQHLSSQNQLAKMVNISTASMARLKTNQSLPSEETILKVAALAGIAPEKALIDLNLWRAKDDENRLKVWQNISKMIQISAVFLIIFNMLHLEFLSSDVLIKCILCKLMLFSFVLFQSFKIIKNKLTFYVLDKSNI